MSIPDGWNNYTRVGAPVEGTRFIAFKVPLREGLNTRCEVAEEKVLYPKLLKSLIPNLGIVIDLTNTTKYYQPEDILNMEIQYKKIQVIGQKVPSKEVYDDFRDTVKMFLKSNAKNDKLIGVHCTHGVNRTGYLVCRYMIEQMQMSPITALESWEIARGHHIERQIYIDSLKSLEKLSIAIDTSINKGTQTKPGYWIDSDNRAIKHDPNDISFDESNDKPEKVPIHGYVRVHCADLIPDNRGGYFIHVKASDIREHEFVSDTEDSAPVKPKTHKYRYRNYNLYNCSPAGIKAMREKNKLQNNAK